MSYLIPWQIIGHRIRIGSLRLVTAHRAHTHIALHACARALTQSRANHILKEPNNDPSLIPSILRRDRERQQGSESEKKNCYSVPSGHVCTTDAYRHHLLSRDTNNNKIPPRNHGLHSRTDHAQAPTLPP